MIQQANLQGQEFSLLVALFYIGYDTQILRVK